MLLGNPMAMFAMLKAKLPSSTVRSPALFCLGASTKRVVRFSQAKPKKVFSLAVKKQKKKITGRAELLKTSHLTIKQ